MTKYETISDIEAVIIQTLGDYVDDYDTESIAREISDWQDGKLVADNEREDYWQIVERHAISQNMR